MKYFVNMTSSAIVSVGEYRYFHKNQIWTYGTKRCPSSPRSLQLQCLSHMVRAASCKLETKNCHIILSKKPQKQTSSISSIEKLEADRWLYEIIHISPQVTDKQLWLVLQPIPRPLSKNRLTNSWTPSNALPTCNAVDTIDYDRHDMHVCKSLVQYIYRMVRYT